MLAYYDSFSGLVPCRIITAWSDRGHGRFDAQNVVRVVFTADRGPYHRGTEETLSLSRVIPRTAVRRRRYSTNVAAYNWPALYAHG